MRLSLPPSHALVLALALLLGGAPLQRLISVSACTSLLVAGGATADGSVLLGRSDDGSDAISDTNNLVLHPPRSGPAVWRSNMNALAVSERRGGSSSWHSHCFELPA